VLALSRNDDDARQRKFRRRAWPQVQRGPVQLRIGNRLVELRRPVLRRHEAAFVLGCTLDDVRNAFRRGERLQGTGHTDEEVVAAHGLPVSRGGRARGVSPSALMLHPDVASSPLALAALAAIVEGRLRAPMPVGPRELPPRPLDRLDLL
jgi:hypothetical protein